MADSAALPSPPTALASHNYTAFAPGPRLIVLGAVHGNELAGTRAIQRVLAEFDGGTLALRRGSVTFVPVTNPLAYQRGQRAGDRNLNRNLRETDSPRDFEDRVANVLCPLLARHDVLLDLHSFHTPGQPFVLLGPVDNEGPLEPFARAREEESLALRLGPRRVVEGWMDTYARGVRHRLRHLDPQARATMLNTDPSYGVGTTEYMRARGGFALTLECGQHEDPAGPEVGYRAIRHALAHLGLADLPAPPVQREPEVLRISDVYDRNHAEDSFARPWASFDRLRAGDIVGLRHDGTPVPAPRDGFILFPNPGAAPGYEWFYFAEPSNRVLRDR